jgi:Putative auto-transporter adhesin, head GIN domain
MRTNTAIVFAWVVMLAALLPGCSNAARSSAGNEAGSVRGQARLEIKGSPGTEFVGSCALGDGEPAKIGGEAPRTFSYDLEGRALDCEVSSDDSLRVELAVGENTHSAQSIISGTLHLNYENGSVSTSTSSTSGSHGVGAAASSHVSSYAGTDANGHGDQSHGPVTKKSRAVSGFDGVELRGAGNLYIEQTGRESLTVKAEKAVFPELTTRVVDGRLIIGPGSESALTTPGPINYYLTVKNLNSLEVLGTANAEATGIETGSLMVTISGAGNVRMEGQADEQTVEISGTGTYLAENLRSREVNIVVAGAGSAVVNARENLYAEISGVGSVEYVGDPRIHQTLSGAGHVSEH